MDFVLWSNEILLYCYNVKQIDPLHCFQDKEVSAFLSQLAEEVSQRLVKINVKGKSVTLKLKVRKKGAPKETAKFMGK